MYHHPRKYSEIRIWSFSQKSLYTLGAAVEPPKDGLRALCNRGVHFFALISRLSLSVSLMNLSLSRPTSFFAPSISPSAAATTKPFLQYSLTITTSVAALRNDTKNKNKNPLLCGSTKSTKQRKKTGKATPSPSDTAPTPLLSARGRFPLPGL